MDLQWHHPSGINEMPYYYMRLHLASKDLVYMVDCKRWWNGFHLVTYRSLLAEETHLDILGARIPRYTLQTTADKSNKRIDKQ